MRQIKEGDILQRCFRASGDCLFCHETLSVEPHRYFWFTSDVTAPLPQLCRDSAFKSIMCLLMSEQFSNYLPECTSPPDWHLCLFWTVCLPTLRTLWLFDSGISRNYVDASLGQALHLSFEPKQGQQVCDQDLKKTKPLHRGRLESINLEHCCADPFCNIDICNLFIHFYLFF